MKQQAQTNQPVDAPAPEVLKRVLAYAERSASSGRFPYEGQWLTMVEIEEQIRAKRRTALMHARELSALFFFTYVLAAVLWKFISLLTY
ncbi:MAG: hypothetical protein AB7P42_09480 [Gammaproteobacteria bacterium]